MKNKTTPSKHRSRHTNRNTKPINKKNFNTKGGISAGMTYAILAILIAFAGGSLMIGSIAPISTTSPTGGQPVITLPIQANPAKNNLQLFTFPGATYTPTPSPTPTPQPTHEPEPTYEPEPTGDESPPDESCFPEGTKILLANKKQKNIEEIKIGDKVMGYDGTKQMPQTVLRLEAPIRDHLYKLTFADGSILKLTNEHPLFTSDGWKSISPENTAAENPRLLVGVLAVGDLVLDSKNNFIKIISMEYIPGKIQTYNLKSVTGFNNFYADGKLAHNKDGVAL
ncbi:hypothetical protein KKF69_08525 [Patescibacteria group bacterium]|nr:hypothetical protein [Patescibacteria group bacterium]MBU4017490.1 hypothetical protein [Patescibacteria group bacterium]